MIFHSLILNSSTHDLAQQTIHHHAPEPWVTYLFTALLVGLIFCLAFEEKLHAQKSVIASSFALLGLGYFF